MHFSLTWDLFCGRMLTVDKFSCIGRKYNLDCDPTFAFRSLAAQEQFKGFSSLTPKTQYVISNPPVSFNCGKPLISPSSPLSPHVTFCNTSVAPYPLSQVWFSSYRVQHGIALAQFFVDDGILDWWRLAKHRKLTVQVLLEKSFLIPPRPPLLLLPLRLLKRAMRFAKCSWSGRLMLFFSISTKCTETMTVADRSKAKTWKLLIGQLWHIFMLNFFGIRDSSLRSFRMLSMMFFPLLRASSHYFDFFNMGNEKELGPL